jgi:hypothetical protein
MSFQFPSVPSAGRAVARRWPALVVGGIAAAVPLAVLANPGPGGDEWGPSRFYALGGYPALEIGGDPNNLAIAAVGGAYFQRSAGDVLFLDTGSGHALRAETDKGDAIRATSYDGTAIEATSKKNGPAVEAIGKSVGVRAGVSEGGFLSVAVDADSIHPSPETGVKAFGTAAGVSANSQGAGLKAGGGQAGVEATSTKGYGVRASSESGTAVFASSSSAHALDAVTQGSNTRAVSVQAFGAGSEGLAAFGAAKGIYAEGAIGLEANGYSAPLRLRPASTSGAPTTGTHKRGELFVDSQGNLFLCVADSVGTGAGTWKKVVLQ